MEYNQAFSSIREFISLLEFVALKHSGSSRCLSVIYLSIRRQQSKPPHVVAVGFGGSVFVAVGVSVGVRVGPGVGVLVIVGVFVTVSVGVIVGAVREIVSLTSQTPSKVKVTVKSPSRPSSGGIPSLSTRQVYCAPAGKRLLEEMLLTLVSGLLSLPQYTTCPSHFIQSTY